MPKSVKPGTKHKKGPFHWGGILTNPTPTIDKEPNTKHYIKAPRPHNETGEQLSLIYSIISASRVHLQMPG